MCQHLVPTDAVVGFHPQTASLGPSYRVVESMAAGLSPKAACADVIAGISKRCQRSGQPMFEVAILAISKTGEVGAGSTFGNWRDHVTGTATSTSFWAAFRAFLSSTPPRTRRGLWSTWCPVLPHADWCLQSAVMPDSRLQASSGRGSRTPWRHRTAAAAAVAAAASRASCGSVPGSTRPCSRPPERRQCSHGPSTRNVPAVGAYSRAQLSGSI